MNNLLILTEGGKKIGMGHYVRCSAIQDAVIAKGYECKMLLDSKDALDVTVKGDVSAWMENENVLAAHEHFNTVLVDSYLVQADWFQKARNIFNKIIVIDDYNRIVYPADVLINPNVYFNEVDYSNQTANCIGGKDYVILREVFRKNKTAAQVDEKLQHLLITIGGTDFRKQLPTLCHIALSGGFSSVTVICPDETERAQLIRFSDRIILKGMLTADEMLEAYKKASLVVAACGSTLHELASLGKPTIGICLDRDQEWNRKFYFEKGFLTSRIDWNDGDLEEKIVSAICSFRNRSMQEEYIANAGKLVGKDGVDTIVNCIFSVTDALQYRLANAGDCEMYFNWANDAEVRNNALNKKPIVWEQHQQWFAEKIRSRSLLLVFFKNNNPVGQVRIDWEANVGVIDYSVDSSARCKGYGTVMLTETRRLIEKMPKHTIVQGAVKSENLASKKAFVKAGFFWQGQGDGKYEGCDIFTNQNAKA